MLVWKTLLLVVCCLTLVSVPFSAVAQETKTPPKDQTLEQHAKRLAWHLMFKNRLHSRAVSWRPCYWKVDERWWRDGAVKFAYKKVALAVYMGQLKKISLKTKKGAIVAVHFKCKSKKKCIYPLGRTDPGSVLKDFTFKLGTPIKDRAKKKEFKTLLKRLKKTLKKHKCAKSKEIDAQ